MPIFQIIGQAKAAKVGCVLAATHQGAALDWVRSLMYTIDSLQCALHLPNIQKMTLIVMHLSTTNRTLLIGSTLLLNFIHTYYY